MTASVPPWRVYTGDGTASRQATVPAHHDAPPSTPVSSPEPDYRDPAGYVADPGLRDAVNVALLLGQPLLLTGAPGTGKTTLADSVAYELGLPRLTFNTKTTSSARDLFYEYDVLRRFHDSQFNGDASIDDYIEYRALGAAILLAMKPEVVDPHLPTGWADRYRDRLTGGKGPLALPADQYLRHAPRRPMRSVVLIDEIDKAPRDMPNDVLNEIEGMMFSVREKPNAPDFVAERDCWPVVILTSNSEKNLPDAFLRRCVYYHLPRLDRKALLDIVQRRLRTKPLSPADEQIVEAAVDEFLQIRDELPLTKPPATAELLAWITVLRRIGLNPAQLSKSPEPVEAKRDMLAFTYSVLAKTPEDLTRLLQRAAARAKG